MDYSGYALLLLAVGLTLLVAEFFIPSGGLIVVSALIALGSSLWCAWHAWWDSDRIMWWIFSGTTLLMAPGTVAGTIYVLPRTRFGRRVLLQGPTREEVTPYIAERQRLSALIGHTGKTLSLMNPGGLVLVEGERLHAESPGMMIDSGETIEVVAVKGNRLVVRPADALRESELTAEEAERLEAEAGPAEDRPLDFDLPAS